MRSESVVLAVTTNQWFCLLRRLLIRFSHLFLALIANIFIKLQAGLQGRYQKFGLMLFLPGFLVRFSYIFLLSYGMLMNFHDAELKFQEVSINFP